MPAGTSVPVSARVSGFSYAIRNIVAEAKKVEASGRRVRYLNIGDPIPFGFQHATAPDRGRGARPARRPQRLRRRRPASSRRAAPIAAEYTARGVAVGADRVVVTSGTSEGIELALGAMVDAGDEVLVPTPTYPLYTAVLAKIGARAVYYRTDPARGWQPDVDHIARLITARTRALVVIDPNNPTGAVYSEATRRAADRARRERGHPDSCGRGVQRRRVRRAHAASGIARA